MICYICKKDNFSKHSFYNQMCKNCGDFNYKKRIQDANLVGYTALITGARIKIGYQCALKLLRCGAFVIATTRFPINAASRFSKEKDFEEWKDRLSIYGLDLRNIGSLEQFLDHILNDIKKLDIVINNAA